jgi:glycosyltransferase involved in cell wall biosynthesis
MESLKDEFFLIIAGEIAGASETPSEYYMRIIKEKDLDKSVQWIEKYIPDKKIREFFELADAIVLPYRASFHAQSGVLNLAIGYNKPCIVTDVGGVGEIVKTYNLGTVVKPENVEALKTGIIEHFSKKDFDFGFDKYKKDHTWDVVVQKLIKIYQKLTTIE